jgi:hypothetical protein
MMRLCGNFWRIAVLGVVAALAIGAGTAQAAGIGTSTSCPTYNVGQPFLPWLDVLSYTLAPNGGFESGSNGWKLTGGAKVVSGNEKFFVRSSTDRYSLSLPMGSSATSSTTCVETLDAVMRFFAINTGSLLSTLKVEAVYKDAGGTTRTLLVGLVLGTGSWSPVLPTLIVADLLQLPLLTDGKVEVAFRFTPQGLLGGWRIDDVYVDPLKEV